LLDKNILTKLIL